MLPAHSSPIRYDLTIEPDLERFTFDGSVSILVDVHTETPSLVLHSKELQISKVSFTAEGGAKLEASEINFNLKETTVTFVFPEALKVGKGTLAITFVGCLNDQMAGFYRSRYTDIHGVKKIMGSTQFEAIDARRAFPCWDEPARKAVFGITLIVPAQLTAFSNQPEKEAQLLANGKKRLLFMDTPIMSTYLVAFCVGEFDFVQDITKHGVVVRVYTPPGKAEQGRFGLNCAVKSLDHYDDFFGIEYPLVKLDMVAIPEFAMGAMENWGLVTYREVDLLIDPVKASVQQKQRVCSVVAHELAHQWFGNLVTMDWWDDLWLNEGFASFMETWCSDLLFPDWKMWEQFPVDDQAAALRLDSLRTSHPIQVPIRRAEEVEEVFDAISYCKGACVIRMIYAVLGHANFQKGLQIYMKRHAYSNTRTADLWRAWEEASGVEVGKLMSSWTLQMGCPLVSVKEATWGADKVTLAVEQSWFLADGSPIAPEDEKTWTVPVIHNGSAAAPGAPVSFITDKAQSLDIPFPSVSEGTWVKLNYGQGVPMRVLYTPDLLARLANGVRTKEVNPEDRACLLNDTVALAVAGKISPVDLATLLAAYVGEDNSTVWGAVSGALISLHKILMADAKVEGWFLAFANKLITPTALKCGWERKEGDGHAELLLRATMIDLLGRFSTDGTVHCEARKRFEAVLADPKNPSACPSEFKVSVFKIVLRAGGVKEYEQLFSLFEKFDDNIERKNVMYALGASADAKLKRRTLEWATSGAVLLQDFFYPILSVSSSSMEGQELAWAYFKENFGKIKEMLKSASPSLMSAVINYSCKGFASEEKAADVEAFFKEHPVTGGERNISQTLETIRTSAAFARRVFESNMAKEEFWQGLKL